MDLLSTFNYLLTQLEDVTNLATLGEFRFNAEQGGPEVTINKTAHDRFRQLFSFASEKLRNGLLPFKGEIAQDLETGDVSAYLKVFQVFSCVPQPDAGHKQRAASVDRREGQELQKGGGAERRHAPGAVLLHGTGRALGGLPRHVQAHECQQPHGGGAATHGGYGGSRREEGRGGDASLDQGLGGVHMHTRQGHASQLKAFLESEGAGTRFEEVQAHLKNGEDGSKRDKVVTELANKFVEREQVSPKAPIRLERSVSVSLTSPVLAQGRGLPLMEWLPSHEGSLATFCMERTLLLSKQHFLSFDGRAFVTLESDDEKPAAKQVLFVCCFLPSAVP